MKENIYLSSVIIASSFNVQSQSTENANYQQTTSSVCSSGNAILNDSYGNISFVNYDLLNTNMLEPTVQFYYSMNVNYRIVIEELAKRKKEDRDLDCLLCTTQIQQQRKNVGGNPAIVNTTVNVRTK